MADFNDFNNDSSSEESAGESEDELTDPLDQLGKREQDIFFRVLDLIPEDKREVAMEYFMSHPAKIAAVVENVKKKKELIEKHDQQGLETLLQQEQIELNK